MYTLFIGRALARLCLQVETDSVVTSLRLEMLRRFTQTPETSGN